MDWWAGNQRDIVSSTQPQQSTTGNQNSNLTSSSIIDDQLAANGMLVDTTPTTTSAIFDPWLTCEDVHLGAPLHQQQQQQQQHQMTVNGRLGAYETMVETKVEANLLSASLSSKQNFSLQPANKQNQRQAALRLPPDNKRHIMRIINNSTLSQQPQQQLRNSNHENHHHHHHHQQQQNDVSLLAGPIGLIESQQNYNLNQQQQQQQQQQQRRGRHNNSASSAATSPLSSSLGSSPPNQQANFLSPSNSPVQSHLHSNGVLFSNETANSDTANEQSAYFSDCFVTLDSGDCTNNQQQQQRFISQHQDEHIFDNSSHSAYQIEQQQQQQNCLISGQQRNCFGASQQQQAFRTTITSSGGGSSLLTSSANFNHARQSSAPTINNRTVGRKSVAQINSSSKQNTTPSKQRQSTTGEIARGQLGQQKLRRCRHITDYVLAEEEKRLLIKEGHSDFPMSSCSSRPLTKVEERILRKIRRKIRNKKSAQCSRQRKKEYVEELERKYASVLRENEQLKQVLAREARINLDNHHQQEQQQQQQQIQKEENGQSLVAADECNYNGSASGSLSSASDEACSIGQINWRDLFAHEHEQGGQLLVDESNKQQSLLLGNIDPVD